MLLPSWPPTAGLCSWGGSSSQNLLLPPGGLGQPQLCGPVGKRAAVCRQHTAVRVVTEEPAGAGLESFREEFPLCFRVPLPPQLLFPPVANVNPPIQNCIWNKENRRRPRRYLPSPPTHQGLGSPNSGATVPQQDGDEGLQPPTLAIHACRASVGRG